MTSSPSFWSTSRPGNCIHAGLHRIFVVTQYQSESLNWHVADAYKFDACSLGAVNVLAAEQTEGGSNDWFRGTADAVRKRMKHLGRERWNRVAILAAGGPDNVTVVVADCE